MNWRQSAIRVIATGAALCVAARPAWGQSCDCRNSFVAPGVTSASNAFRTDESRDPSTLTRRLPADWPQQWSKPSAPTRSENAGSSGLVQVRDPFTGKMVPSTAQTRWDRAIATRIGTTTPSKESTSRSTQSAQKNSVKSWSILPSPSGSAIGGAIGSGGGAGGASGGIGGIMGGSSEASGGGGGGSSWSPRSGGSGTGGTGGGSSNRSDSGTLGSVAIAKETSGSTGSGSQITTNTNTTQSGSGSGQSTHSTAATSNNSSGSSSSGGGSSVIEDPWDDKPIVCAPETPIPDYTPEIPTDDHPSPGGGPGLAGSGGETPVVPEPGSLILLGIAGAGAGIVRFRNCQKGRLANVIVKQAHHLPQSALR